LPFTSLDPSPYGEYFIWGLTLLQHFLILGLGLFTVNFLMGLFHRSNEYNCQTAQKIQPLVSFHVPHHIWLVVFSNDLTIIKQIT
jgi:hypothetical protein